MYVMTKRKEGIRKRPSPKLDIEVTQEHIDEAVPRNSSHCMIAQAIKSAIPGVTGVAVDLQTIRFSDPSRRIRYIYLTPRNAQQALVDWDMGVKPEPFVVKLQAAQVNKMASRKSPDPKPERRSHRRKTELTKTPNGAVPVRVGGKAPPLSDFSRIRAYGLRGLNK
jgi:hypothetical protein